MIQMRQLSFTSLIFLSGLCAGYTGLQNWRVLYLFLYLSILHFWGNCTISLRILKETVPEEKESEEAQEEEAASNSDDDKPVELDASSSDEEVKEGESSDESTDAEFEKKNA